MHRLVVDASVVIKWLNPYELLADNAILIRNDYEQNRISLFVPAFWDYEVSNGINKAVNRGHLSEEEGNEAVSAFTGDICTKSSIPSAPGEL